MQFAQSWSRTVLRQLTTVAVCGLLFALAVPLLRLFIIYKFSPAVRSAPYYYGILASGGTQWLIGCATIYFCWKLARSKFRLFAPVPLMVVLFFNIFCFHYETVFYRLPGFNLFYYAGQLTKIGPSLAGNTPVLWVIPEYSLTLLILIGGFHLIKRFFDNASPNLLRACFWSNSLVMVAGIIIFFGPGFQNSFYWGSREPLSYFQQSIFQTLLSRAPHKELSSEDIALVRKNLGLSTNWYTKDITYPLYEKRPEKSPEKMPEKMSEKLSEHPTNRSVIMIIIEGLDARMLEYKHDGIPIMPNFAKIAQENLSFSNFYASGSQSAQALPGIFSGQPTQSNAILLRQEPMVKMSGFPAQLRDHGYSTAYLHGSNLTYENQDLFLKMVGFNELQSYDPKDPTPYYGWGYSDEEMLNRVQKWVTNKRKITNDMPYLISLFTVSTHDPYTLPETHKKIINTNDDKFLEFVESARFLDMQLAKFYRWFQENEAPKGTILVITSDHIQRAPYPDAPKETSTGEFEYSFRVPLVISGLTDKELAQYRPYSARYGAHLDLPATLLYLTGYQPLENNAGFNLLSTPDKWVNSRYIVSVAPDDYRFIYLQKERWRWMYDITRDNIQLFDTVADTHFQHNLAVPDDPATLEANQFFQAYIRLNKYLLDKNAYTPIDPTPKSNRAPIPSTAVANYVLKFDSARDTKDRNNGLATIQNAIDGGFKWVQLYINLTKDSVPVILPEDEVTITDGRTIKVIYLTYEQIHSVQAYKNLTTLREAIEKYGDKINFLIETHDEDIVFGLSERLSIISKELLKRPANQEIILNAFDIRMARASVDQQCNCPLAYDIPSYSTFDESLFQQISRTDYQWVYFEQQQASLATIELAHKKGLKVMLTDLDNIEELSRFGNQQPDFAIVNRKHPEQK